MPVVRKVWDMKAKAFIEMYSVNAKEAVKNDPERYSFEQREPAPEPAPAPQPEAPLVALQPDPVVPEAPAEPTSPPRKKK